MGRPVSVTITHLTCCSLKAVGDNMKMNGHTYVPIKFYLQK